jgi:hypothetical protein
LGVLPSLLEIWHRERERERERKGAVRNIGHIPNVKKYELNCRRHTDGTQECKIHKARILPEEIKTYYEDPRVDRKTYLTSDLRNGIHITHLWWKNCNKAGEQNSYSMYGFLIIMPISIS